MFRNHHFFYFLKLSVKLSQKSINWNNEQEKNLLDGLYISQNFYLHY